MSPLREREREATGYEPCESEREITGYEPFERERERQQVTSPSRLGWQVTSPSRHEPFGIRVVLGGTTPEESMQFCQTETHLSVSTCLRVGLGVWGLGFGVWG